MSVEANRHFRKFARQYYQASPRAHDTWLFDYGVFTAAHSELAGLGLIVQMLGTRRGFAWKLSAVGLRQIAALEPRGVERPGHRGS